MAVLQHTGDHVEVPGHQHRLDAAPHQRVDGGLCVVGHLIFEGENALQRPVDHTVHGPLHLHAIFQLHIHHGHKAGGADQHLVAANVSGQSAGLIALQVVHPAVEAALSAQLRIEEVVQSAARRAEHGRGTAGEFFQRNTVKVLDGLHNDAALGEQILIFYQDVCLAGHGFHTVPAS